MAHCNDKKNDAVYITKLKEQHALRHLPVTIEVKETFPVNKIMLNAKDSDVSNRKGNGGEVV